tara:strand:- start:446 stop:640 length:195 start_codon:yes stop_codon:yes gene_type:complete
MATKKQIYETIKSCRNDLPEASGYISVHRNIVTISNGHSVMRSDIGEIKSVHKIRSRDGNGYYK